MFLSFDQYRPNADELMGRIDACFTDAVAKKPGHLLLRTLMPGDIALYENLQLNTFDFESEAGIDRYIAELCLQYHKSFATREGILDDAVPVVSPVLGIGDYSAFVAGDIAFASDTSWSKPLLAEVGDYKKLPPLGTSVWYQRFLLICEKLMRAMGNCGLPFTRGFFSPMDLAGALRGEGLYFDFYDDPDELRGLLDYCADATIRFAEDIYALAEQHLGNTKHGTFYLRNKINMSEDISCMISGELYRTFAAPATQKVIDHFGVGHMHTHSCAMYLVKEICALKNVANLWLATDPNQPRPIEHIKELCADSNGVCIAIDCENTDEIERNLDELKHGNFSICMPVSSYEEAQTAAVQFDRYRVRG